MSYEVTQYTCSASTRPHSQAFMKRGHLNMVSKCQLSVLLLESKRAEAAVQRTFTFGEAASFIVQH